MGWTVTPSAGADIIQSVQPLAPTEFETASEHELASPRQKTHPGRPITRLWFDTRNRQ